jgi:hypothetical protein
MPWTLFSVPTDRRTDLQTVLGDDLIGRQSQTIREAPTLGGPAGRLYVLLEGSGEAIARADAMLAPIGSKLPPAEAEPIYRKLQEERESASAGMGLFFTE